jgi:hypothetical protein
VSRPDVGEYVIFFVSETDSVPAEVIDVTFWDHIAVRLPNGQIKRDVRRVVTIDDMHIAPITGRFIRVVDGY